MRYFLSFVGLMIFAFNLLFGSQIIASDFSIEVPDGPHNAALKTYSFKFEDELFEVLSPDVQQDLKKAPISSNCEQTLATSGVKPLVFQIPIHRWRIFRFLQALQSILTGMSYSLSSTGTIFYRNGIGNDQDTSPNWLVLFKRYLDPQYAILSTPADWINLEIKTVNAMWNAVIELLKKNQSFYGIDLVSLNGEEVHVDISSFKPKSTVPSWMR